MATAMAHGAGTQAPLVSIVVDNGSYGTIRMHQERHYPERVSATALHNPDFAALARAHGWNAARVERTEQFEPAFAQALQSRLPTLIHLLLDTEVISPRASLSQLRAAARP
jgi:acetolactate synthase I/II/III large subunit